MKSKKALKKMRNQIIANSKDTDTETKKKRDYNRLVEIDRLLKQ